MVLIWMIVAIRWTTNRSLTSTISTEEQHQQSMDRIEHNNVRIKDQEIPKSDGQPVDEEEAIALKVQNAKKVLITYGEKCCETAKVRLCDFRMD